MSKAALLIPRVKIETNINERQMRSEIAREAASYLKYEGNICNTSYQLSATLDNLGISVLHSPSVERYKLSKEKKVIKNSTLARTGIWSIGLPSIAFLIRMAWISLNTVGTLPFIVSLGCGLGVLVLLSILVASCDEDFTSPKSKYVWRESSLPHYEAFVPMFALSKAIEIKKALPDARFHVQYLVLEVEQKPIRLDSDPFLVVKQGDEKFYLDVWDEEEFEKKM